MTEPTSQRAALWLLAMKGHPATGKSTLARALAQPFSWPLIDKDDIKDHLLAAPGGKESMGIHAFMHNKLSRKRSRLSWLNTVQRCHASMQLLRLRN